MNKTIKQKEKSGEYSSDINIDKSEQYIYLMQCDDILKIRTNLYLLSIFSNSMR